MQKQNVLHLINNLNVSGATTLLLDIAAQLKPHHGEFTVCSLEPQNPMARALADTGAHVVTPDTKLGLASGTRWACQVIRETRPAIIHTHLLPATQVGLAASRLMHIPALTTVHFMFDSLRTSALLRQMNRVSFKFYDRIIAISGAVRQSILEHCHVRPDRVTVLRNGIDFTRTCSCAQDLRDRVRRELGVPQGRLLIGSIGRLDRVKSYDTLITATAKTRDAANASSTPRLVLVGDGAERKRLEQLTAELDLADIVTFAGTQEDPSRFLAAFDVFVLPSISEGLGLSIIEAMGAGLPVIGSTTGGIPEVITHGASGLLFEPGNSDELADCLRELAGSEDLRTRLGAAARASVEKQFDIAAHVDRLYMVYAEMLASGSKAAFAETTA